MTCRISHFQDGSLIDWLMFITSSERNFSAIFRTRKKIKRHGTRNKERWWVWTDNLASATGLLWTTRHVIMSCYTGRFFNVRRGWQSLNTGPLFYLRLIRRTGWLLICISRTTDGCPFKPKKLSVPSLYPGVPAGLVPLKGLVLLGRRNLVPILPPAHLLGGGGNA
jgi:hypothetical protein